MSDHRVPVRWRAVRRFVVGMAVIIAAGVPVASIEAGRASLAAAPSDTTAETADTTAPPDTTVPSSVATSVPTTETVADEDDSSSINAIGVVIGIIGIVALLGVAAWWMVRRDDPDDAPHPPGPSSYSDLI